LSQKSELNHFYNLTQNILFDTLLQSVGTDDVIGSMATRVTWGKIRLAAFDGPSPKTPL